ncbi:hypothetical protein [Actinomadura rubrisoli]|uniref:Uncharacterized protein n=1 Tax=Actinomadura rubrisoli TaxID=2530368 RepID=A0A4R5A620_9ACTN|nr:hypothetical protein [Actinomadura rubrisoli]TDD67453.1 hypothetical protein E1298_39415 [Actinomadura rubrisoli]
MAGLQEGARLRYRLLSRWSTLSGADGSPMRSSSWLCRNPGSGRTWLFGAPGGTSGLTSEGLWGALGPFKAPVFQLYGMTETTEVEAEGHVLARLMRSAGRPYEWADVEITEPGGGVGRPPGVFCGVRIRSSHNTKDVIVAGAENV